MANEQTRAAMQRELRGLSEYGVKLPELLDHFDRRNRLLGRSGFSNEQEEELQLYCWALQKSRSNGVPASLARFQEGVDDDIGG